MTFSESMAHAPQALTQVRYVAPLFFASLLLGVAVFLRLCADIHSDIHKSVCDTCAESISFEQLATALKGKASKKDGQGNALGWAARDDSGHLAPFSFDRRGLRDDDVHMQITHCGICHSDLHQIKNEWHNAMYPMVPGYVPLILAAQSVRVTNLQFGDSE